MRPLVNLIAAMLLALASQSAAAQEKDQNAAQAAPVPAESDPQYAKMHAQMRLMQSQMEQMGRTQDPKERQRLLEEHWTAMQKMMTMMHGKDGTGGPMMDRCMPMHRMMMQQMMEHQHGMMQQPPAPPPKK